MIGFRVDDLDEEVVLVDVQAVALEALAGDPRPDDLGEPVIVRGDDPEGVLDLIAHLLGPRLPSEEAVLEGERRNGDPHLADRVGDQHRVGRGGHQRRRPEVLHDLDLARGVPAGRRDHRGAEPLRAVVEPEPPREQPVPERDLDDVVLGHPAGDEDAGHQLAPHRDVVARVAHDRRRLRRAGRGVDADDLPKRDREQPVGVISPHVLLRRERQPGEVGERPDLLRGDPERVELLPVERDVRVNAVERRLQPLELELLELLPIHALLVRFPVHSAPRSVTSFLPRPDPGQGRPVAPRGSRAGLPPSLP